MQVSKWGNSLAIRLPAVVVDALELREGDNVEVFVRANGDMEVARKPTREDLLERLKKFEGLMPADFKFDRDDANGR